MKTLFIITLLTSFSTYSSLSEIDSVLNKARAIDVKSEVKNGPTLKSIKPNSIYSKLGLKSGDQIHKINGKKVSSLIENISDLTKATDITVIRNGKKKVLEYDFE